MTFDKKEYCENVHRFLGKGRPNNCQAIYLTQKFAEIQPISINTGENITNLILFKASGSSLDKSLQGYGRSNGK